MTLALAALQPVDPGPGALVIPLHRTRPGTRREALPLFGHLRWELAFLSRSASARSKAFSWSNFPAALRDSFMRIAWAMINISTPAVLQDRLNSSTRPFMALGTLFQTLTAFRYFARWLDKRGITTIGQIDRQVLEEYAASLGEKGFTNTVDERRLFAITRIWAYAPFLLPEDQLVMPPWDDPGSAITDFLDDFERSAPGENDTEVIHPATMSPLLVWALRTVVDLSADILAAYREWQRLTARIRPPGTAVAGQGRVLRDWLQQQRRNGGRLPTYTGHTERCLARQHTASGRPPLNNQYLAGLLNLSEGQIIQTARDHAHELEGLAFADGAPLRVAVAGTVDGQSWTQAIDFTQARPLAVHLSTAALLTIGYLSGMRPEEVLHLERGCSSREERENGTVRYRITGRHFKGVTDKDGNTLPEGEIRPEPWTVIELVDRAVKVLEALHGEQLLFPRSMTQATRTFDAEEYQGQGLDSPTVSDRIKRFIGWANQQAVRLGRDHEIIPADPHGSVTLRRLRRTVAWFIYRLPGGRIALGLQYGHVGTSMAESYGGRTKADMLEVLDFEETLAIADALAEASDRLEAGESVSGPAADRYIAAAREFTATYGGGFLTKSQLRNLRNNPRLRIFEDPDALLTCNYDFYKALCDPEPLDGSPTRRMPNRARCNPACANISRTDTHIRRAENQIEEIDAELEDQLAPKPLRLRHQQCRSAKEGIIERHQADRRKPADTAKDDA
ncbi:hypothetical protein ADK76_33395 [Streptomyces griseoflavus]|uniref:hypothetical protein n=1 Tax=Streptomyces rimosus TaxID=1927 RepID=UPI0004C8B31E|nr:hypothetical protein [Streptomyces rimosus]KOG52056.1 hypothetical protein ADK76_33395 [Streptomyces griseoflavus]